MSANAENQPGANDQATKDAATAAAATAQANATALATAQAEARTAERARVGGITGCDEAKGRTQLANHLAMNTDMSVDAAKAVLAASPVAAETPKNGANPFKQAMDNGENPNVGADGGSGEESAESAAQQILAAQSRYTGLKLVNDK